MGSVGLLPCFVVAHFVHHLLTALPIPLLPLIRSDYALDYTLSGWVVSAFNLAYGIGQLPAGWLADRIGPRIIITVGICGVALAGLFVGLSQSFGMLLFFLALMGFLGGGYHPASPPLIAASVEAKNRGRALGLHTIGGGASYFLAPLIGTAIAVYWGWRGSFIWLAGPTIVFGLLFYLLLGRHGNSQAAGVEASSSPAMDAPPEDSNRNLAIFIFLSTFTGAVIFATISFIPLFLVDHFRFRQGKSRGLFCLDLFRGSVGKPHRRVSFGPVGKNPPDLGGLLFRRPRNLCPPVRPRAMGGSYPPASHRGHHLCAHARLRILHYPAYFPAQPLDHPRPLFFRKHGRGRDSHSSCRLSDRSLRFRRELHDFGSPSPGRHLYLFPPVARQPGLSHPA